MCSIFGLTSARVPRELIETCFNRTISRGPDMSRLEKIIYLADYIEPTREFEGVEKLRELAYKDLDAAMALGLEMSLEELRRQDIDPYKDSIEACLWYCRQ